MFVGADSSIPVLNPRTFNSRASPLPTVGSNCISPYAFACEIAPGLNSDSCRINDATRLGSNPFACEYLFRSVQYGRGNNPSQYGLGNAFISTAKYAGTARFSICNVRCG